MPVIHTAIFLVFASLIAAMVHSAQSLSVDEKSAALITHNSRRALLAQGGAINAGGRAMPTASNFYALGYDPALEQIAQAWADNCQFSHSSADRRNRSGENLYYTTAQLAPSRVLEEAAAAWWNELDELGFADPTSMLFTTDEFKRGIGHWTQMAWASTTRLGCGVHYCPGLFTLVVCNYAPAGNVLGQRVYAPGKPCSADSQCTAHGGSKCSAAMGLCQV